jgi:two-component system, cell cycle response regulator CpdR
MTSEMQAMVLLLGSEPINRAIMKEVLEGAGYGVLAAGDLGTAVDMLAESQIDLLLTHPYIEDIPGHEAAKYLRARNPRMGVLMVAGFLNDDRLEYRAELEEFEIFPTPFTAAQLLEKVEEVLKMAREREARNMNRSAGDAGGLPAAKT